MPRLRSRNLIELSLVASIVGVLASTTVPHWLQASGQPQLARLTERAAQITATAQAYHAHWQSLQFSSAVDDLPDIAGGQLDSNEHGWPVASDGSNTPPDLNDCVSLWRKLQAQAPGISVQFSEHGYTALRSANGCDYRYNPIAGLSITYDSQRGVASVVDQR